ncbi:hypothetical protein PanWU01x14_131350, partial [Parasponia andersonii]
CSLVSLEIICDTSFLRVAAEGVVSRPSKQVWRLVKTVLSEVWRSSASGVGRTLLVLLTFPIELRKKSTFKETRYRQSSRARMAGSDKSAELRSRRFWTQLRNFWDCVSDFRTENRPKSLTVLVSLSGSTVVQ